MWPAATASSSARALKATEAMGRRKSCELTHSPLFTFHSRTCGKANVRDHAHGLPIIYHETVRCVPITGRPVFCLHICAHEAIPPSCCAVSMQMPPSLNHRSTRTYRMLWAESNKNQTWWSSEPLASREESEGWKRTTQGVRRCPSSTRRHLPVAQHVIFTVWSPLRRCKRTHFSNEIRWPSSKR